MSFTSGRSRWGDISVVSVAQLLSGVGTFLVMTGQVLAFQHRAASGTEVAALIICEALPMVVLGKPAGWLVDRVDSRVLLVVAGLVQAGACIGLSVTTQLSSTLAGVLVLSAAAAVSMPTRQALLPAMAVRDDLPRAAAFVQTAGSLGMMAGPALAGLLFGYLGAQGTVRVATVGFVATVVAAFAVRTRRGTRASQADAHATPALVAPGSSTVEKWGLHSDAMLRVVVWGMAAVVSAVSAVNVVLVFFVMGTLHSQPRTYGVIDATWMLGILVGSWLFGFTVRPSTRDSAMARRLLIGAAVISTSFVAVGSVRGAWWVVPCYVVGGAANGGINVLAMTLLGRRVPPAARGRAGAAIMARTQGGSVLGYVAGGLLLDVAQPRWIVLGCGILGALTALAILPIVGRVATADVRSRTPQPSSVGAL
ncbi:MAG TPA: MFS transporter [Micromonosporaceae bacterium]